MENKERYARQRFVIGKAAQKKISNAHVAIVGIGALGSVSAELMARAGVGTVTIIDRDVVEESNLQRQLVYTEPDIGKPKAEAAFKRLKAINSTIKIISIITDVNHKNIEKLLKKSDIVLDCTDNLYTRFLINDFSKKYRKAWVYAGCIAEQGSVALLTPQTACFRCFTKEASGLDTCDTAGVLNTASTMTASIQVQVALHWLMGTNKENSAILHHMNLKTVQLTIVKINKNKQCPACGGTYEFLSGSKELKTLHYQCSGMYQFFIENIDINELEKKALKLGKIRKGRGFLFFDNISVFENGRILVKAPSADKAKSLLSRYIGI
jgi:adenylyltransferase/sulfurtransferase